MLLIQLLILGLQDGALYALTAVGFSLIFGSTKIFHFAHGSTFTIAAYVFYYLYAIVGCSWWLAAMAATLATVSFGVLLDRLVYMPIRQHEGSFFTLFIAAFGVAIVVQNLIGIIFGRSFVSMSTPLSRSIEISAGIFASPLSAIAIVCAIMCFGGLHLFLMRTHVGIALRALSENSDLVRVYGLSPRRLSTSAFALGSLLVVPAAIFTCASAGLNPSTGNHVMLISLAAAIVGGVGSIRGTACAGVLLGLVENLVLWRFESQWTEAAAFCVMFLFILFRPSGFFGRPVTT